MGSVYQLNAALYLYLHHFLFRMNTLISTEWNISKKNCIVSQIILCRISGSLILYVRDPKTED